MPKRLITLRLSDEEIGEIDAKAELAGESRTRYLARRGTEDDAQLASELRAVLKQHGL